ncbi:MAG: hypothetical protein U0U67_02175 [Chitinophagales bacterium]
MKKILNLTVLVAALFISTNGFSQGVKTENKTAKAFLDMLDGTEATADKAIAKFGSKTVIDNKMIPFGKKPVIYKEDGNCISFYITYDGTKNAYIICTKGDKIDTFDTDWDFEAE